MITVLQRLGLTLLLLCPDLRLASNDYGTAFLVKIENNTAFPADLTFSDNPADARTIGVSGTLGKSVAQYTESKTDNSVIDMASKIVPVTLTGRNVIRDPIKGDIENSRLTRNPIIKGHCRTILNNFTINDALLLSNLRLAGAAWFAQKIFALPCSLSFEISCKDNDAAAISWAKDPTNQPYMQIIFGAEQNQAILIQKDGKIIGRFNCQDYPQARLQAGSFKKFWLSLDAGGNLLLGQGETGQQIFHHQVIENLDKNQMTMIGLANNAQPTSWQNLEFMPVCQPQLSNKIIIEKNNTVIGLSTQFVCSFEPASLTDDLIIKNPQQEHEMIIKKSTSGFTLTTQSGKVVEVASSNGCLLLQNGQNLLILEQKEQWQPIMLLPNSLSIQTKFLHVDKTIPKAQFFQTGSFAPNISGFEKSGNFTFEGQLQIVRPFSYQFSQEGPAIVGKDLISQSSYILGQAVEKNGVYSFSLTIDKDGQPEIKWDADPVNPTKFAMKFAAALMRMSEGLLYTQADKVPEENAQDVAVQIKLTAENLGYSFAGMAARTVTAPLEATIATQFRQDKDVYVAQEKVINKDQTQVQKSPIDQKQDQIKQSLSLILEKLNLGLRSDYEYALNLFGETLVDINSSARQVLTSLIKTQIYAALKKLQENLNLVEKIEFEVVNREQMVLSQTLRPKLIELVLNMLNNPSYFDQKISSEKNQKTTVIKGFNELVSNYLTQKQDDYTIPVSLGYYLWTDKFLTFAQGCLYLEIEGASDFLIGLSPTKNPELVNNPDLFSIVTGANNNQGLLVYSNVNREPDYFIDANDFEETSLYPGQFRPFWFNFESNAVQFGTGQLGQNQCGQMQDPQINKNHLWVGFSSFYSQSRIRKLAVGPCLSFFNANMLNYLSTAEKKSAENSQFIAAQSSRDLGTFNLSSLICFDIDQLDWQLSLKSSQNQDCTLICQKNDEKSITLTLKQNEKTLQTKTCVLTAQADNKWSFWLNWQIEKVEAGQNHFWQNQALFSCPSANMQLKQAAITLTNQSTTTLELSNYCQGPSLDRLSPDFLRIISSDKIILPEKTLNQKTPQLDQDAIFKMQKELEDQDPLANNLLKIDQQQWADPLYYQQLEDQYDPLVYNPLHITQLQREASNLNITSEPTAQTTATTTRRTTSTKAEVEDDVKTGYEQKMAQQGMAGALMEIKGEAQTLTNMYANGLGVDMKKDVGMINRDFGILTAKKGDTLEAVDTNFKAINTDSDSIERFNQDNKNKGIKAEVINKNGKQVAVVTTLDGRQVEKNVFLETQIGWQDIKSQASQTKAALQTKIQDSISNLKQTMQKKKAQQDESLFAGLAELKNAPHEVEMEVEGKGHKKAGSTSKPKKAKKDDKDKKSSATASLSNITSSTNSKTKGLEDEKISDVSTDAPANNKNTSATSKEFSTISTKSDNPDVKKLEDNQASSQAQTSTLAADKLKDLATLQEQKNKIQDRNEVDSKNEEEKTSAWQKVSQTIRGNKKMIASSLIGSLVSASSASQSVEELEKDQYEPAKKETDLNQISTNDLLRMAN